MDDVITKSNPQGISIDIECSAPVESSSKSSFFDFSDKSKMYKFGLIVLILLFLGVNIFTYLGDFFQNIRDFFAPIINQILKTLGYVVTEVTEETTDIAAEGAKLGIDVAAGDS